MIQLTAGNCVNLFAFFVNFVARQLTTYPSSAQARSKLGDVILVSTTDRGVEPTRQHNVQMKELIERSS